MNCCGTLDTWVNWADIIAGFSTLAAFGAAGIAAIYAAKAARSGADLLALERTRDEAQEKRDQEAAMRLRRQQADLVSVWIDASDREVVVHNGSGQPIYDLRVFVFRADVGHEKDGSLSELLGVKDYLRGSAAGEFATYSVILDQDGKFLATSSAYEGQVVWPVVIFRDATGDYWTRRPDEDLIHHGKQRP